MELQQIPDSELSERSRTRPQLLLDRLDVGPDDLIPQLPLRAELVRPIPGADGQQYALAVAHEAVSMRSTVAQLESTGLDLAAADPQLIRIADDGTVDLLAFGLVLGPRIVGQAVGLGMRSQPVTLAYVVDNTAMHDEQLDVAKVHYAAVLHATHLPTATYP